jgi:hypothetical protein
VSFKPSLKTKQLHYKNEENKNVKNRADAKMGRYSISSTPCFFRGIYPYIEEGISLLIFGYA